VSESTRTFEAVAVHEGKWWEISFTDPELDTVTATRKIGDIQAMATDAAALWLDVDPATIEVHVSIAIPDQYRTDWEKAQAKASAARAEEAEAARLSRAVVRGLRDDGYTLAEAGVLLGLSKGRVHQLAATTDRESVSAL
jgi:hypothetical protein